jgi:hypothetical protein
MRLPPAWSLVLFGLVLNVMAILMSSVVLENLGSNIDQLEEQKSENIYAIQLAWNRVETLERKREVLLIALAQDSSEPQVLAALQQQLSDWVTESVPDVKVANLPTLMDRIDVSQQTQREQIDNYYLKNLSIAETMAQLDNQIAWYKSIGLFLQVFGLALILARDLARKS